MSVRCRQFQPADADACSDILRACIVKGNAVPSWLRDVFVDRETRARMIDRASRYYIAVCTGADGIVGVGGLDMNEIRLLAVAPGHQRQGCGKLLLDHLEGMVPPALFREVFVYSARASEGFYLACGYVSRGEHVVEVQGHPVRTTFMIKTLDRSDLSGQADSG